MAMSYLKKNFLLTTKTAEKLYFDYAKKMPIFDYHCHLPEKQILENARFSNIYEIWLAGDHYKWRLMRNYGIDEKYITGDATDKEKFIAYCQTLSTAFGNPLYHWSQVELAEFFDCELEINEKNAAAIWKKCNKYIKRHKVTPASLIKKAKVKIIFTTNEVFDDLSTFREIAEKGYPFKVIPAFRGDKIMNVEANGYTDFLKKLEALTFPIKTIGDLEAALAKRLGEFMEVGCVAADISLEKIYPIAAKEDADKVLAKAIAGGHITDEDAEVFKGYLTYSLMKLYAANGIRTELHIGPMRNNNSVMMRAIGADTGFDSISDENSIKTMSRLFDALNSENSLPRTIVFNLNPKLNAEIMSLIGCFQSSEAKGKLQFGPAWWFLDNKVGMEKHLRDLTATGHIATFVGMLTDSRSLLSYPRHHYFRRILCDYLGGMMERGEMTTDLDKVGNVVRDISYNNSISYFGMEDVFAKKSRKKDSFDQMDKNTVSAEDQLKENDVVKFDNPNGKGKRILFVGNSITLHGVKQEIGWNNCYGMAASAKENDYVHLLEKKVAEIDGDAAFCVCQGSDFEVNYNTPEKVSYSLWEDAKKFGADIIVFRLIENCKKAEWNEENFKNELDKLLSFFSSDKEVKIVMTTGFWKHPGDETLRQYAKDHSFPIVELGDLGEQDEMKAIGLFEHNGVANHPGDKGMAAIADRIFDELKKLL